MIGLGVAVVLGVAACIAAALGRKRLALWLAVATGLLLAWLAGGHRRRQARRQVASFSQTVVNNVGTRRQPPGSTGPAAPTTGGRTRATRSTS